MSGSASERVAVVTASARSLPALIYSIDATVLTNVTCTCPPNKSVSAGPARKTRGGGSRIITTIGHGNHVDAGHHLEQLAGHVRRGPGARRPHVEFAGIGLGVNELGNRLGGQRGIWSEVGPAADRSMSAAPRPRRSCRLRRSKPPTVQSSL